MSLVSCLKKAGKVLSPENKAAVLALATQYREAGEKADAAGLRALQEHMAAISKARETSEAQLSQGQGGAVQTADAMRKELAARFPEVVQALEQSGVLKLWDTLEAYNQAAPDAQLSADFRGAQGMFLNGVAHLFGDGVTPGNAVPVFLHEVGEHASMKDMLGSRYKGLVKQAWQLAKDSDPVAQAALMRIPENTQTKFMDSEMVAYLIEEAAGRQQQLSPSLKTWLDEVVAAIKAFLFEKGLNIELSPQDIAALAVRAVEFQAAQGVDGRVDPPGQAAMSMGTLEQSGPRATLSFGNDITAVPSIIALLENADLSSFLHESGHLFLEVQADLAARIQSRSIGGTNDTSDSEAQIVTDMNAILEWMGVNPADTGSRLDAWLLMPLEEKREHHEKWARGFEKYLGEGRAPSQELQSLFSKFRAWMLSVYQALKGLNVDLSDDVRGVMDRMLATDAAIEEAEMGRNMGPLFESLEKSGMTPAEYRDYQALGQRQTAEAAAALDARLMKDMKWLSRARDKALKARQAEVDDLRREVELEVRAAVLSTEVYQAWQFLTGKKPKAMEKSAADVDHERELSDLKQKRVEAREAADKAERAKLLEAHPEAKGLQRGQLIARNKRQIGINVEQTMLTWDQTNPQPAKPVIPDEIAPAGFEVGKLNTDAAKAIDKKATSTLQERRMTSPEGLDPDAVADRFNFSSGDHLIKALASAPPPSQVIEEMVDQQMLERYGDITSPEAMSQAADEAVHNEVRARVVATELKALEKATTVRTGQRSTVDAMARAAREYAYAIIAGQRVRDLRPSQYSAAQARSAKLAMQALGKSTEEAAMHKRNELINGYAAKAAYDAQEEVRALQKYMRKFDKRIDSIDPGYQDQIEQLLERFDFKPATNRALDKRARLADFLKDLEEDHIEPDIPQELMDEANRKNFREMTVEELRGLRDTVKQIEHLGRLKNKLLTAKDNRDFAAIRNEIVASIAAHAGGKKADNRTRPTALNASLRMFNGYLLEHRKFASLARELDGFEDGGPVWESLIRSMNEAGDNEATMRAKAAQELAAIVKPMLAGGKRGGKGLFFDGVPTAADKKQGKAGSSFNREERLVMALNTGNEGNLQRLLDGEGWTPGQLQKVLDTLTAPDWRFVQGIWDHFEGYRPLISSKQIRLYGKDLDWVKPTPRNVVVDGEVVQLRGGYLPAKYDTSLSARAESLSEAELAKQMLGKAFTASTTKHSYREKRSEEVKGRPLLYSTDVIFNGVNEVIHDLTYHEWVIDASRLLKDKEIDEAIRSRYGAQFMGQLKEAVKDIAAGEFAATRTAERIGANLRAGTVVAGMGLNIMNSIINVQGITQSMARIGIKWAGIGIAKYTANPIGLAREVWGKSEFMANRSRTLNREVNEIQSMVRDKTKARQAFDRVMFLPMTATQVMVDMPTWWGAYQKALDGAQEEARAVSLADQAVLDSQSGGQVKDLAAIQRGGPWLKLWTTFYGFFSGTYNLTVEKTKATNFRDPFQIVGLAGNYLLLWTLPALLGTVLKNAMTGDDWDEERLAKKAIADQVAYLLGMMIGLRETASAMQMALGVSEFNMGYGGPAGARFFAELSKLAQQAHQGEMDLALFKALDNVLGILLKFPSGQINRSVGGAFALAREETDNPLALIAGPPSKN